MEQVIRNMSIKPLLESVNYERLAAPTNNAVINMRTWDEIKVERLRSDAVKVSVQRFIKPEPSALFALDVKMSMEVLINVAAYEALDDPEAYFKGTQVMQVLVTHLATVMANITMFCPIGPIVTAPAPMISKQ